MSDCRFGVSPVNYPDPDPDPVFLDKEISPLDISDLDVLPLNWFRCYHTRCRYRVRVPI